MKKPPSNVVEFRALAKQKLEPKLFEYIENAACDEVTKHKNEQVFDRVFISPFSLKNVADLSTCFDFCANQYASPIIAGPTAFHQWFHPNGELATANACQNHHIPMILSTMSSMSLEDVAQVSSYDKFWLQTYLFRDKSITLDLIERAEKAGFLAIVLSVGVPESGKREKNIHTSLSVSQQKQHPSIAPVEHIQDFLSQEVEPGLTWQSISWLKSKTKLPILLKGILNPMDAQQAYDNGVSGIIVSNHGGRQLDTSIPSLYALSRISQKLQNRLPIFLDGGVRRGTDIIKAIALGADAILLGKPILWALAYNGEQGVSELLSLLHAEFKSAMRLCGVRNKDEIRALRSQLFFEDSGIS